MKSTLLTTIALVFILSAFSQVKDVDGNEYKTVKIGEQEWMAENLNVTHFRNGEAIPMADSNNDWYNATEKGLPAMCKSENGKDYLYNWYAVNDSRGIAPDGWHIPNNEAWNTMIESIGGFERAGSKMKSKEGWYNKSNCTNESGFSAISTKIRNGSADWDGVGFHAIWWSLEKTSPDKAWVYSLYTHRSRVDNYEVTLSRGLTIRCLKSN